MMARPEGVFLSAVAAGFLIAIGPVDAGQDQQDLSAREVKGFFESAERDVTQMVQAGDYARLIDWARDNLADGATFFLSQELYVGDERKSFAVTSLDKQDMLRLSRVAVGLMSDLSGRAVQDYALDIEVIDVEPIGPNAATAATRIAESGKLALPRAASAGGPGGQASGTAEAREASQGGFGEEGAQEPGTRPIQVEATARCNHLVQRGDNADQLVIGLSNCEARVRF